VVTPARSQRGPTGVRLDPLPPRGEGARGGSITNRKKPKKGG